MSSLLGEKEYPRQYPHEAVEVLNAMSFSKGKNIKIVGSSSLKSQLYAGDYDAHEVVEREGDKDKVLKELVKEFQHIIKHLQALKNVYIGDIKAGKIEEWDILAVQNPTYKVESLLKDNIISSEEATQARKLLKGSKLKAKQELKFHIIRWTPQQILAGKQTLRDGRTYTLEEAFSSPTITKLDTIALVNKRYTEFSIIYEFYAGSNALNPDFRDPAEALNESVKLYTEEGNRFKVLKRKFSLAKLHNKPADLKKFHDILNSEAGKLYILYSDVKVLGDLLESHTLPSDKLKQALKQFSERLRVIYQHDTFLKPKQSLLEALRQATTVKQLRQVEEYLFQELNNATALKGGWSPIR